MDQRLNPPPDGPMVQMFAPHSSTRWDPQEAEGRHASSHIQQKHVFLHDLFSISSSFPPSPDLKCFR